MHLLRVPLACLHRPTRGSLSSHDAAQSLIRAHACDATRQAERTISGIPVQLDGRGEKGRRKAYIDVLGMRRFLRGRPKDGFSLGLGLSKDSHCVSLCTAGLASLQHCRARQRNLKLRHLSSNRTGMLAFPAQLENLCSTILAPRRREVRQADHCIVTGQKRNYKASAEDQTSAYARSKQEESKVKYLVAGAVKQEALLWPAGQPGPTGYSSLIA